MYHFELCSSVVIIWIAACLSPTMGVSGLRLVFVFNVFFSYVFPLGACLFLCRLDQRQL